MRPRQWAADRRVSAKYESLGSSNGCLLCDANWNRAGIGQICKGRIRRLHVGYRYWFSPRGVLCLDDADRGRHSCSSYKSTDGVTARALFPCALLCSRGVDRVCVVSRGMGVSGVTAARCLRRRLPPSTFWDNMDRNDDRQPARVRHSLDVGLDPVDGEDGYGNDVLWKPKNGFHRLGNLAQNARFPHSHSRGIAQQRRRTSNVANDRSTRTPSRSLRAVAGFEVSIDGRFSGVHRGVWLTGCFPCMTGPASGMFHS
jgi:hypothetical protein